MHPVSFRSNSRERDSVAVPSLVPTTTSSGAPPRRTGTGSTLPDKANGATATSAVVQSMKVGLFSKGKSTVNLDKIATKEPAPNLNFYVSPHFFAKIRFIFQTAFRRQIHRQGHPLSPLHQPQGGLFRFPTQVQLQSQVQCDLRITHYLAVTFQPVCRCWQKLALM